jgi:hypothetical protein
MTEHLTFRLTNPGRPTLPEPGTPGQIIVVPAGSLDEESLNPLKAGDPITVIPFTWGERHPVTD